MRESLTILSQITGVGYLAFFFFFCRIQFDKV